MALTPEQIKAQGYTILTDPNQVKDYIIAGQYGVSGQKGSFLYGKPKAGASLTGTLPPDKPTAQPLGNPAVINPQLPNNDRQLPPPGQGSLAAFQDVLKQISYGTLQQNKPSVADVINQYTDKGLSLVNPSSIESAYSKQADLYARPIGDIYQSTMAAMQEVEKTKQEKFNTLTQDIFKSAPGFISSLTGEEFDKFKNLQFSPEMQVKLKQAQDLARQQEIKPPTIAEQLAAQEAGYNIVDNKIVKDTGPVGKDPITGAPTDPSKVIQGFNFTSYATDPKWGDSVNRKLSEIGKFNTPADIDKYIKSKYPNSKVTSDMITTASQKYQLPWEMITAIMDHESLMGTSPVAMKNNNPAGTTWNGKNGEKGSARPSAEGGFYVKYPTMQDGINVLAKNIANRRQSTETPNLDNSNALNVILGSTKFTAQQKRDLTNSIKNGEDPLTVIKNQAKNIMGQTLATDLDKYEVAKSQLESIQTLLTDFYSKGGKTNIFSGNLEKVINNLGSVNNPELVEIATNIQAALQIYRNAVSGTAYSVQEGKDIASIFPGINKTEGLNNAIIKGRLKAFDTTIDSKYTNTLGKAYTDLKNTVKQTNIEQQKTSKPPLNSFINPVSSFVR